MATQYNALPGGDGGEWTGALADAPAPPRHLVPVASSTSGQPIRRRQIKSRRVNLTGEFEGWWVQTRTNGPIAHFMAFAAFEGKDGVEIMRAFASLIAILPDFLLDWNWVDEEGAALPCDPSAFATLSAEELMAIMKGIGEANTDAAEVPKSDAAGNS